MDLSDPQAQILEKMIAHYAESKLGLTGGAIEKKGVNRKTFANNIDWLLERYYAITIWSENHGLQVWKYYTATPLGILAYLKWIVKKDLDKTITFNGIFAPLLAKHLNQINEWYGDIVTPVMRKTINQINVDPTFTLFFKSKNFSQPSQEMTESMTLTFGLVDVIFYRNMGKSTYKKIHKFGRDIYDHSNNKKFTIDLSNRFTFAFFFNLINLGYSGGDFLDTSLEVNPPMKQIGNRVHLDAKEKIMKKNTSLEKRLQKNKKKVMQLINDDDELFSIFKSTLNEISSKIKEPKVIQYLQKSL